MLLLGDKVKYFFITLCVNEHDMMSRILYNIPILALVALAMMSCRGRAGGTVENTPQEIAAVEPAKMARVFIPSPPPALLPEEQKQRYYIDHYWDKFDFADTTFIAEVDFQHMLTAYAVYVGGHLPDSLARPAMSRLMQKASASKPMFDYFLRLADVVLHDPNSQMRSDEKYIPVLEAAIASSYLDEYEKLPYVHDLEMALKNRVGEPAEDFRYTVASGVEGDLYDIKAEYTLIFISNPGCPMCRDIREQISASPKLNEMIERKSLKILVIYPDEDLEAWHAHAKDYPESWINAYDKKQVITKKRLYDLRAIPSLYLLDSEKKVVAKDCTNVEYIEHMVMQE